MLRRNLLVVSIVTLLIAVIAAGPAQAGWFDGRLSQPAYFYRLATVFDGMIGPWLNYARTSVILNRGNDDLGYLTMVRRLESQSQISLRRLRTLSPPARLQRFHGLVLRAFTELNAGLRYEGKFLNSDGEQYKPQAAAHLGSARASLLHAYREFVNVTGMNVAERLRRYYGK